MMMMNLAHALPTRGKNLILPTFNDSVQQIISLSASCWLSRVNQWHNLLSLHHRYKPGRTGTL